ncbi:cytochrome P450 [Artemisia annua]|uniref:Cytochrome P450 n=1 Tax=Artemisia annua TaxID=35608 RepID=A0A2U1K964_ARTAN|nr:cytochrome P450 [Artemisia annua]
MSRNMCKFTIETLWGSPFFDFASNAALGKSGGLLAVWDKRKFVSISTTIGDGFLAVLGSWQAVDIPCLFVVVYAPQDQKSKLKLWDNIEKIIALHDTLSVILGDFNEVRFASERKGTNFNHIGASHFNSFISNAGLSDLPLGGKRFTRMNNLGSQLSKLDRILVSSHFMDRWPNSNVLALPREFSDHTPLLLNLYCDDYGPIPFKMFNSWLAHEDFPNVLNSCWPSTTCSNNMAANFKSKLQSLKQKIKQWRSTLQVYESVKATDLRNTLNAIDDKAELVPLSQAEIDTRVLVIKELTELD